MPDYNFKNNLKSTLQAKLWNDATSISCNHVVVSEDADTRRNAWPAFPFTLTIVDTANGSTEVIKCTGLAGNSNAFIAFTCARAQENTTAKTFEIATTNVEHRLTAGALNTLAVSISTISDTITVAPAGYGIPRADAKGKIDSRWYGTPSRIFASFNTTEPDGLLCNGGAYSRTTYADLFAILGTSFGAGNGSTTFNVPDFRGRTLQGANANLKAVLAAGLPNVEGELTAWTQGIFAPIRSDATLRGPFYKGTATAKSGAGTDPAGCGLGINLGLANAIYGNSTTVQPPAIAVNIFIKY